MARKRIGLPEKFSFTTTIPIRISDVNYGGHVGNDTILSLIHEARMQYLRHLNYSEVEFAGVGLIMANAAIEFKKEIFYGDVVQVSIACGEFSKVSFDVYYKLEKVMRDDPCGKATIVATAQTTMACFNYEVKKIVSIPQAALRKLQ